MKCVYDISDHLGNTRVSFTKNSVTKEIDVLQVSDYYPFGLQHEKENAQASSGNVPKKEF